MDSDARKAVSISDCIGQRFSTGGPRTPGGPRRVARGSASKLSKILML